MDGAVDNMFVEPFREFAGRVAAFLPNLLTALIVLAAGLVISRTAQLVLGRGLVSLGLDRYAERHGIVSLFKKGGIKDSLSGFVGRLCFWLLLITFIVAAVAALDVPQADEMLSRLFMYLPSLFLAVLIIFLGWVVSNFLAKAALVWAVNAGMRAAGAISRAVRAALLLLTFTMALEQLSIGRSTVLIVFALLLGGVVLALAIAFGLGAKDLAREYLERQIKGDDTAQKDDISHL